MTDTKQLLERAWRQAPQPDRVMDSLIRRRDRKRRNQRIAAGVVGIAVFVTAIWIVTSGLSLDRSEKSVAPAGEVTGPAETGPAETAPPPARASAAPDVSQGGPCSGQSRSRLNLTDLGDKIRVVFVIYRPHGAIWRIVLRHGAAGPDPFNYGDGRTFFSDTRNASIFSPDVRVRRFVRDLEGDDGFAAKAVDTSFWDQVCNAVGVI